jgi:hypothetical protein
MSDVQTHSGNGLRAALRDRHQRDKVQNTLFREPVSAFGVSSVVSVALTRGPPDTRRIEITVQQAQQTNDNKIREGDEKDIAQRASDVLFARTGIESTANDFIIRIVDSGRTRVLIDNYSKCSSSTGR